MKIAHVAFKSTIEGGETVLINLVLGMRKAGHQLYVIAPEEGPLIDLMQENGIATEIIPLRHIWEISTARQLACFIDSQGIDLVQSHGKIVNILTRIAMFFVKRKPICIATEHNPLRLKHGGHEPGHKAKAYFYRYLDNISSRQNDAVVCVSEAVKADKLEQGIPPEKLFTIENGINLKKFESLLPTEIIEIKNELNLPLDVPILGTVARFDYQKNVSHLINAMPKVWESFPQVRLVIVGKGHEQEELKKLSAKIDQEKRIIFTGYRTDANKILQTFDIFCLSSRWEGLPLIVLEAMACGKSMVTTPVESVLSTIEPGKTALIAPWDDPAAMGEKIVVLLKDQDLREKMGRLNKIRAEKMFSAEAMVANTLSLYGTFDINC